MLLWPGRLPAPSALHCCAAQRVRRRPIPAGVGASSEAHLRLRMSGQQGRRKQSRDGTAEDAQMTRPGTQTRCWWQGRGAQTLRLPMCYGEVSRISLLLPLCKTVALASSLRRLTQPRKASSLLCMRRGRAPRGKLRLLHRRNQCYSPSCSFTTHTGRQHVRASY